MLEYIDGNTTAIIVLHEIYGVNDFIRERCLQYRKEGYDVFCPDLFCGQAFFPYAKEEEAYLAFRHMVGFDAYEEINDFASKLRLVYSNVIVIGFSAGATLAWRCSESMLYDGIICCYGSRIRDYLNAVPGCPVLLVFAGQDSFDVTDTVIQLCSKKDTTVEIIEGRHGFADCYCENYSQPAAELFDRHRKDFLAACTFNPVPPSLRCRL